jgi:hypothetical protein
MEQNRHKYSLARHQLNITICRNSAPSLFTIDKFIVAQLDLHMSGTLSESVTDQSIYVMNTVF